MMEGPPKTSETGPDTEKIEKTRVFAREFAILSGEVLALEEKGTLDAENAARIRAKVEELTEPFMEQETGGRE
jgi:hypothetical protein